MHDFSVRYALYKTRDDAISVEHARSLLISLAEGLLKEINSDPKIRPHLDTYPLTNNFLQISLYFLDENKIDLGQGVAQVHFSDGQIKYKRYEIHKYTRYPAEGKHFVLYKESYAEALEIVKKQGSLMQL